MYTRDAFGYEYTYEVNADRGNIALGVRVVRESQEET